MFSSFANCTLYIVHCTLLYIVHYYTLSIVTCSFSQGQEYYAEGVEVCNYPANPERATATAVVLADPSACTKVGCKDCPVGTRNPAESSNFCHTCTHMKEYTTDKINCLTCDVVSGM